MDRRAANRRQNVRAQIARGKARNSTGRVDNGSPGGRTQPTVPPRRSEEELGFLTGGGGGGGIRPRGREDLVPARVQ